MDRIPVNVQRHIAGFTKEAGAQVRSGGRFLGGERDLREEQNKCVCGICVRTRNVPREKCTLFRDGDVTLVERQQTDLCKPVCMSRSPLRMLGRFIGHLLSRLSKLATSPIHRLALTLQRDDSIELREPPVSTFPYLFSATYLGGEESELELLFFTSLENDRDNFEPYNLGDTIDVSRYVRNAAALARLSAMLERALIDGDGKKYSVVCVCLEIPETTFQISGIQFRSVGNSAFRAWPLFLFTQAAFV